MNRILHTGFVGQFHLLVCYASLPIFGQCDLHFHVTIHVKYIVFQLEYGLTRLHCAGLGT
jgi:hypothetical protein